MFSIAHWIPTRDHQELITEGESFSKLPFVQKVQKKIMVLSEGVRCLLYVRADHIWVYVCQQTRILKVGNVTLDGKSYHF